MTAAKKYTKARRDCRHATVMAIILTAIAAAMLIGAALTPPMSIIDSSILAAVGELFAFAALFKAGEAIDRGIDAKLTHGNTTIELTNPDDNDTD